MDENNGTRIGKVSHYFPHVSAMALSLEGDLKVGDKIHVKGKKTDFEQIVGSMQIDREPVEEVKAGQDVGIKADQEVKVGDEIFLI